MVGEENPFGAFLSVTLLKYKNAGQFGVLGILSPVRADYVHNLSLVEFIQEQEEPVTILFSALRRKDFQEMLGLLEKRLPHVPLILTSFAYDGALSEKNQQDRDFVADYQQFIEKWQSDGQGILIITGSLYFISEVRRKFIK